MRMASYVLGIAQKAADGHIPTLDEYERMTEAEIVERPAGESNPNGSSVRELDDGGGDVQDCE